MTVVDNNTTTTTTSPDVAVRSLEVPLRVFAPAVTWVEPAAARVKNPQSYSGIHLIAGPAAKHPGFYDRQFTLVKPASGYALTVAATDRYRLMWSTLVLPEVDPATAPDLAVNLHRPDLLAALKAFGRPDALSTVTLHIGADKVRFEAFPSQVSYTVHCMGQNFPTIAGLLGDIPHSEGELGPFALNHRFLREHTTAAGKVGHADSVLQFAARTPEKAFGLRVESAASDDVHHSGILMPVRMR